jgi:hypothetical protein
MLNSDFFVHRPDVELRVYGFYGSECDLTFAGRMTNVRRFAADCLASAKNVESIAEIPHLESLSLGIYEIRDFAVLRRVSPTLRHLSIGATRSKRQDLAPIARFRSLIQIYLEGQCKNIEVLSDLTMLEDITLRSITTPGLDYLRPLSNLWSLDIKLGGIKSFTGIEGKESIKYLELWQIRELSDIDVISYLPGLQNLFLQSLPRIRALPALEKAQRLRRVLIENMKGLSDFRALEWAPALQEFALVDGRTQDPAQLLPVLRNPALLRAAGRFGSDRKNDRFFDLLQRHGKETFDLWSRFQYH